MRFIFIQMTLQLVFVDSLFPVELTLHFVENQMVCVYIFLESLLLHELYVFTYAIITLS